jgi:NAD(P)-dependent dehydrogenase (short-subunit alcohol dehydrogenase family)
MARPKEVVVITRASAGIGIGRATVQRFGREGARIGFLSRVDVTASTQPVVRSSRRAERH